MNSTVNFSSPPAPNECRVERTLAEFNEADKKKKKTRLIGGLSGLLVWSAADSRLSVIWDQILIKAIDFQRTCFCNTF